MVLHDVGENILTIHFTDWVSVHYLNHYDLF